MLNTYQGPNLDDHSYADIQDAVSRMLDGVSRMAGMADRARAINLEVQHDEALIHNRYR